jgi:NAD(P)-dependent dehydrogenase (short-subunit alcohol dehydrogenase family)
VSRPDGQLRFDGRVAIVTGAGGGLGREYAFLLASRGASVVVNDLGTTVGGDGYDEARAQAVVSEIKAEGGRAVANIETVTTTTGAEAIVRSATEAFGGVDIVINNAGISAFRPFGELSLEEFDRHVAVHLGGSFNVTRAAWPHMVRCGYGRVVMTASSAIFGLADLEAYASAKSGLIGLGRSLALSGEPHGIKVNVVAPAAATRMWSQSGAPPADLVARMRPHQPAGLVTLLSHEDCPVSGEMYRAAGGLITRLFIGETDGVFAETPEEIASRFVEIHDTRNFFVPADSSEINARAASRLSEARPVGGRTRQLGECVNEDPRVH